MSELVHAAIALVLIKPALLGATWSDKKPDAPKRRDLVQEERRRVKQAVNIFVLSR